MSKGIFKRILGTALISAITFLVLSIGLYYALGDRALNQFFGTIQQTYIYKEVFGSSQKGISTQKRGTGDIIVVKETTEIAPNFEDLVKTLVEYHLKEYCSNNACGDNVSFNQEYHHLLVNDEVYDLSYMLQQLEFDPNTYALIISDGNSVSLAALKDQYYAGEGLRLSGVTFSLDARLGDLIDVDVASVAPGQVLKWNGTKWIPAPGGGAAYSASGALLQLTGTTFSLKEGTLTNGYLCTYDSTNGLVCNTNPTSVGTDSQTLTFNTGTGQLSISNGNTVDLSTFWDNTDNQTLSLSGNTLSISGGNGVDLSVYLDNTDSQTLSWDAANDQLTISGGNTVSLADLTQSLTWDSATNQLTISSSNTVDLSELEQTLTLSGVTLSISNGNSVTFTNWDTDVTDDVQNLTDLQDVTITSPATAQVLRYDGTTWVNSLLNFSDISDVNTTSATAGQLLRFDGTTWTPQTLAFTDLSDTPANYGTAGYLVQTDGTGSLQYVDPLTLDVGYWQRTGTTLSPRNAGDDIVLNAGESLSISDLGAGGVVFTGTGGLLSTNPSAFYWDSTNNRLGIGTATPSAKLHLYDPGLGGDVFKVETQTLVPALSGWNFRKSISVTNGTGATLTDTQLFIQFDTASLIADGKMNPDCSDMRFTAADGVTLIPYWIEAGCNTSQTKVWVKLPNIPTGFNVVAYMYYGNPNATSAANGDAVFELFDDFNGASLDTTKWVVNGSPTISIANSKITLTGPEAWGNEIASVATFSAPLVVRASIDYYSDSTNSWQKVIFYDSGSLALGSYADTWEYPFAIGGALPFITENPIVGNTYVYTYKVLTDRLSSFIHKTTGGTYTQVASGDSNITTIPATGKVVISAYSSNRVDWIAVYKYVDPPLLASLGAEEAPALTTGPLQVNFIVKDGLVGIHTNNPQYPLQVGDPGDGTVAISNAWYTFSDKRFKESVTKLDNSLAKILSLRGVSYRWKESGKPDVGFIAQEVREVLPQVVIEDPNGYLGVDYTKIIPYLVEAIKELDAKVSAGNGAGPGTNYWSIQVINGTQVITTTNDVSIGNAQITDLVATRVSGSSGTFITLDVSGLSINTNGDLVTTGTITASTIVANQANVSSLQAQSADINTLTVDAFGINSTSSFTGTVLIPQGSVEVIVPATGLTGDYKVFVTPVTAPVTFSVVKEQNQFRIRLDNPATQDLEFDWFVVQLR